MILEKKKERFEFYVVYDGSLGFRDFFVRFKLGFRWLILKIFGRVSVYFRGMRECYFVINFYIFKCNGIYKIGEVELKR